MLKNEGCPLCEVKQERILHRSQLAIALMDAFPVSALSLEHRHYNASLLSFGDLLGYPVPNPERSAVEYLDVPESIWRAESVFLDEISRCRPEVQNKLFSIIHERQVQGKELARLRYRWAAMNPPIADPIDAGEEADLDGYGGSLPLDPALADRFPYVIVIPGIGDLAREDRLALIAHGDQAICAGYANSLAECDGLPPAHWLARRIARTLFEFRREKGAGQVGPDGKVLVRIARKGRAWRPMSVSISLHHHEASDWVFLDAFAEEAVESACAGRATPDITLNGAGMFVCGGPNGDNGQTGKKLVMDAYGPTVPIGGGAWSGEGFLEGRSARKLARARDGPAPRRRARLRRSARDARVLPRKRCAGARRGDRRWATRRARLPCVDGRAGRAQAAGHLHAAEVIGARVRFEGGGEVGASRIPRRVRARTARVRAVVERDAFTNAPWRSAARGPCSAFGRLSGVSAMVIIR
jgi:hypothetical protein